MKRRQLRDLYFRFIRGTELEAKVSIRETLSALHFGGFIELWPGPDAPTHYTDTEHLRSFGRDAYADAARTYIKQFIAENSK